MADQSYHKMQDQISNVMLKKKSQLSIHNRVKLEQHFSARTTERVTIFQACLKLWKRLEPKTLRRIMNVEHPTNKHVYMEADVV